AVGQGERALFSDLSWSWREGGAMADCQGPAAAWCRQLAGRGRAQSRQVAQSPSAPARAGRAWGASPGEPQARRDGRQERHRVRPDPAAHENAGYDRIDGGANCAAMIGAPDKEGLRQPITFRGPPPRRAAMCGRAMIRPGSQTESLRA